MSAAQIANVAATIVGLLLATAILGIVVGTRIYAAWVEWRRR